MMRSYVYLSQTFFLPNQIRSKTALYADLSYTLALTLAQRPGYVEGNTLYLPKNAGGLGIRYLLLWNQAAIGKDRSQGNLWVKLGHGYGRIYVKIRHS